MGEQPGALAAGFNAEVLGGAHLGGWRLLDRRAETRTQALRLISLALSPFIPLSAMSALGHELLGCGPEVAEGTVLCLESGSWSWRECLLSSHLPAPMV